MLVAIALDRHRAITKPLSLPGSPYKLPMIAWFLSLIPSLPNIHIFHIKTRISQLSSLYQQECVSDFSDWPPLWRKLYFSGVALLIFIFPLLLMTILYAQIVYRLYSTINSISQTVGCSAMIKNIPCMILGCYKELIKKKPSIESPDQNYESLNGCRHSLSTDKSSLHCG